MADFAGWSAAIAAAIGVGAGGGFALWGNRLSAKDDRTRDARQNLLESRKAIDTHRQSLEVQAREAAKSIPKAWSEVLLAHDRYQHRMGDSRFEDRTTNGPSVDRVGCVPQYPSD